MNGSARTFGHHLKQFALSVDILDAEMLKSTSRIVEAYVKNQFQVAYFEVVAEAIIDEERGIQTIYSSEGHRTWRTLKTHEGKYDRQLALCFDRGIPLWIVNSEKRPLRDCTNYKDLWSEQDDLPRYITPPINQQIRTSIIVPAKLGTRTVGVLDLEASPYLEITDVAKIELETLGSAMAHLINRGDFNQSRWDATQEALATLQKIVSSGHLLQLAKPCVFVASSSQANEEVLALIMEVLQEFVDKISIVQWSDITESGTVTLQIVQQISNARFGVCYFSEPIPNEPGKFKDNPNVIFEAGMLHALTNSPGNLPSAWVPIREKESPPAPFDFASERIEIVPRLADGTVNEERFRVRLRERMRRLLGD